MKKLIFLMVPVIVAVLSFYQPTTFTITGIVSATNGQPIPFATVVEKGGGGVSADVNGQYRINVNNDQASLIFQAAGFEATEVKVESRSRINVTLKQQQMLMQEVVVSRAMGIKKSARMATAASQSIAAQNFVYDKRYDPDEEEFNTEGYDNITENSFLNSRDNPLSTISIDVDAASYSNVRRILKAGQLPAAGAVRIEEMINYFHYNYPAPQNDEPFSFTTEMSAAPWNPAHKLVMIGMQGRKIPAEQLPSSNLVFLIDVSGSMEAPNKLGLVKSSLKLLADQLREQDKVSVVVYAGAAGLVLPPTSGSLKTSIKDALDKLSAGGSTAGGEGIELAYKIARQNFVKSGNNRVILCTDGDFNIGASSDDEMERLIEKERKSGVFLTVLGYGMGNYKDNKMQKLAGKGNGNHAYIDGMNEAKKVLVNEFGGTLFTIAKDVKLQVEFNPTLVQGYRLLGYENRMLKKEDFNDDEKDAGDMGSGHTVTAIYEIIPAGIKSPLLKDVDDLKYTQKTESLGGPVFSDEIMNIKFRYKAPDGEVSKLVVHPVKNNPLNLMSTSENFRFAAAVAQFGMLLRNSAFKGHSNYASVLKLAKDGYTHDVEGYKKEFIQLVETAQALAANQKGNKEEVAGTR